MPRVSPTGYEKISKSDLEIMRAMRGHFSAETIWMLTTHTHSYGEFKKQSRPTTRKQRILIGAKLLHLVRISLSQAMRSNLTIKCENVSSSTHGLLVGLACIQVLQMCYKNFSMQKMTLLLSILTLIVMIFST